MRYLPIASLTPLEWGRHHHLAKGAFHHNQGIAQNIACQNRSTCGIQHIAERRHTPIFNAALPGILDRTIQVHIQRARGANLGLSIQRPLKGERTHGTVVAIAVIGHFTDLETEIFTAGSMGQVQGVARQCALSCQRGLTCCHEVDLPIVRDGGIHNTVSGILVSVGPYRSRDSIVEGDVDVEDGRHIRDVHELSRNRGRPIPRLGQGQPRPGWHKKPVIHRVTIHIEQEHHRVLPHPIRGQGCTLLYLRGRTPFTQGEGQLQVIHAWLPIGVENLDGHRSRNVSVRGQLGHQHPLVVACQRIGCRRQNIPCTSRLIGHEDVAPRFELIPPRLSAGLKRAGCFLSGSTVRRPIQTDGHVAVVDQRRKEVQHSGIDTFSGHLTDWILKKRPRRLDGERIDEIARHTHQTVIGVQHIDVQPIRGESGEVARFMDRHRVEGQSIT